MAEKLDMAMNTFPQVTNAEYVYAEAADGSQVKIKKSDLAAIMGELLRVSGLHLYVTTSISGLLNRTNDNKGIVFAKKQNSENYAIYSYTLRVGMNIVVDKIIENGMTGPSYNVYGTFGFEGNDVMYYVIYFG